MSMFSDIDPSRKAKEGESAKVVSDEIDNDIIDFIARRIRSVGLLDALMLFAQDPSIEWNADELSRELRTNPSYASSQIDELTEMGLLIKGPSGKFRCCDSEKSEFHLVNKLKDIYKKRPSKIISIIYDKPLQNMRGFIDAFKLRKE